MPANRIPALLATLVAAGCARDVSLPPPPGPGTIQGRVVYAVPGQAERAPAQGARVAILSTSLGAIADAQGRFIVEGVTRSDGLLLVQADLSNPPDGVPDRQTLLDLAALKAGPGRDAVVGDVVVVENARVRGRALRQNVPGTSGHAGTMVFVPQGPFITQTADDGSYQLANLPEGRITLTFFRDGYEPAGIDGIALSAGQDLAVREVVLLPGTGPGAAQPGAIGGTVAFTPATASPALAQVSAFPVTGAPLEAHPGSGGDFLFPSVAPGLYRVEVAQAGYTTAVVANVLVAPGQETRLAVQLVQNAPPPPPPPTPPPPVTCVAGAGCPLPNPCQIGAVSCATGSPICASIGNALDGVPCGSNQVCSAGACTLVCNAGASCSPANPCHAGQVSCSGGAATCGDSGTSLADGTPCGLNQVCTGGTCAACTAGLACPNPANPCRAGATRCDTGQQLCVDAGASLADGTPCGSGLACQAGACGACTAGRPCAPAGFPCHVGQTSCATGREVCVDTGLAAPNGASCGTDRVCGGGLCNACQEGLACAPANACHVGAIACATGQPVCVDQGTNAPPGLSCGADRVCSGSGSCVACAANQVCTPPNPCHAGLTTCASGAPICGDTGSPLANGAACGPNQVCFGGACTPCTPGALCAPANPCHAGAVACDTGQPVCQDGGQSLLDGAACSTPSIPVGACHGGNCGACVPAAPCDGPAVAGHAPPPASPDPCRVYATACGSGLPACATSGNRPDGTSCPFGAPGGGAATDVCRSGACGPAGSQLRLVGAPHAMPNQIVPAVTLRVVDVNGNPVAVGTNVTVTAPPGALAPAAASTSAADGTVTFSDLRLGRAVGPQVFHATASAAGILPVDFTVTADAPPAGTLLPLANATHTFGYSYGGGAAAALPAGSIEGIAVAGDGSVYYTDTNVCQVRRILPSGQAEVVAGTSGGSCSSGVAQGPATSIGIYPVGIALDEAAGRLYLADSVNQRVRMVDLLAAGGPTIVTIAGDGTSGSAAPWGDGGPATSAQLSGPTHVALGRESPPVLYVADSGHSAVRAVNPVTHVISTVLSAAACSSSGALTLSFLSGTGSGAMAFDEKGQMFLSGYFCGEETRGSSVAGVARRNADGSLTLVAGSTGGILASGIPATSVRFAEPPALAFDAAPRVPPATGVRSNLYVSAYSGNFVGRIDGATGRFDLLAGTGAAANSGDFGPAVAAALNRPTAIAVRPGGRELLVGEGNGYGIAAVLDAIPPAASSASLAAQGPGQGRYPSQATASPFFARLLDGGGTPLSSYAVVFEVDPAGLPGAWVNVPSALTAPDGSAGAMARPGLALGRYGVVASFRDLHGDHVTGSPVLWDLQAIAPPAGTIFSATNQLHSYGLSGVPGIGVLAQTYGARGLALAADGTVYFSDDSLRVYRLAPSGWLEVVAGSGSSAPALDGTSPTASGLDPYGLALDEAAGLLYVGDGTNGRVRRVDLRPGGTITTLTGGGATNADGLASATSLVSPTRIRLAGGRLYLNDHTSSADRLRRVDLAASPPVIETVLSRFATRLSPGAGDFVSSCSNTNPTAFASCGFGEPGCSVAAAPGGRLYVSARFCGSGPLSATSDVWAVVRVEPDGTFQHVAGVSGFPALADGADGAHLSFDQAPSLATDAAGNLWVAHRGFGTAGQRVGYFAAAGGLVSSASLFTLVGVPGAAGEYLDRSVAGFLGPADVAVGPGGHVWVADYGAYAVRVIW